MSPPFFLNKKDHTAPPPAHGKPDRRDSIRMKVLGGRGMGFGEGGGKPFFRRVPSPFPNISCHNCVMRSQEVAMQMSLPECALSKLRR